jgi:serine phosphatase RsbU (regulator of sigma subunit)
LATEPEHAALATAETALARAEALARASAALGSSMRMNRLLDELVDAVVPALADLCTVHLSGREGVEAAAVAVADPAQEAVARALADRQAADPSAPVGPAAVARTGVAEINASITAADLIREGVGDEERELLGRLGIHSAVILPLTARGTVLGALTLAMGSASGRTYQAELVELASTVAAGAGLALDNARLFAEQAAVAAALQRTLLPPKLPEIPGVRLAARYRASGRSNDVGGDFYDVFEAGDGEWALTVGDVVGKGAEAAAITALVRATLQAAILRGDGPRAALALVDEALRRSPEIAFCSAVHGRMRVVAGGVEVRLLAAGHPPPLVLRAGGALEEVGAKGTLLGIVPEPSFGEGLVRLGPGDILLMYTDGATELRGDDPWRGEQALRDTVRAGAGSGPAELVERVERAALVLSGGELRDDLALLAVAAPPDEQ